MSAPIKICRKCQAAFVGKTCGECAKRWRLENKDRINASKRANYKKISERDKARNLAYRSANPEKTKARRLRYRAENLEEEKTRVKLLLEKGREELSDIYVAGVLGLRKSEAPIELIELKRMQLMIKRKIKELKK